MEGNPVFKRGLLMDLNKTLVRKASRLLPGPLRVQVKKIYLKHNHWANPKLKRFGTVQDLYYWVSDENLDTLLILQNYFSIFYPDIDTETKGSITVYDYDGHLLIESHFVIPHCGAVKLLVSEALRQRSNNETYSYGTLQVKIDIPDTILDMIQLDNSSFYFWDRFYLGYQNQHGQTCFVHGVDKADIYEVGEEKGLDWYPKPQNLTWAPEIPVDIEDYKKFTVIMINRTRDTTNIKLKISDDNDTSKDWTIKIPGRGVRRLTLDQTHIDNLMHYNLRLGVEGMPTQYGRPIVFKEFKNGAISAMHC